MDREYTEIKNKIEKTLDFWLPEEPDAQWAERVFGGIKKGSDTEIFKFMINPIRELVYRGGKRWRPILMTLVCDTLGGGDSAIPLSPIVEFSHTASLIHDDIEDESDERRGQPAIHKIFGVDVAINAGSFLYFLASACIETCGLKNKEIIYRSWMESLRRLHLGQTMDIMWHRDITLVPKVDDYFLMSSLKTGSLARLSTVLGVHSTGAPIEAIHILGDMADKIGIGFQILDDVKNLTTGVYGKQRGDDVVEGKKSLPVILYLNRYPEKREQIFYFFYAAKTNGIYAPEVEELIDVLSPTGVFEEAEEKGRALLFEARDIIRSNNFTCNTVSEKGIKLLDNFFDTIM